MCFHQFVRYPCTRTLLYFFLNWQGKHPFLTLVALISAIGVFFVAGVVVSEVLRPQPWGPPVVLIASMLIMLVREPAPKPASKTD